MVVPMEMAKKFFGEKIFSQMLNYLRTNPMENMPRAFDLVSKAAILPSHREQVEGLKANFESNPVIKEYINRLLTQIDENVQNHLLVNFFINASLIGVPKQRRLTEKLGFNIPFTILIDPTSNCNLRCTGCWAGAYDKHYSLSLEEVDRIVTEAEELGIYFIVLSGGEPMLWPHLFELCRKHKDVAFMIYTNGTLIDQDKAKKMREIGNISPAISLEGGEASTDQRRGKGVFAKVMTAMDNLREQGVLFGISLTVTRHNCEEVFSDEFIDMVIEKGAMYGWAFHYIPIGHNPDFSLRLTPEQRAWLVERVKYIRTHKLIQIADFWNDGALTQGCIAGGRRYFHITAQGDIEPCAFVHFSNDKIFGKSLKEILQSPVFKSYQKRQPFSDNMLRPCPLIDVPEALREIICESEALPTHAGADAILNGEAAKNLDSLAAAWKKQADQVWRQ